MDKNQKTMDRYRERIPHVLSTYFTRCACLHSACKVKEKADWVVADDDYHGVAEAIQRLLEKF